MVIKTTVGRVIFNDILHPKMPYYNLALGPEAAPGDHRRLLPDPRPRRDDQPARRDEGPGLPRVDPLGPLVRHRRPQDPRRPRTTILDETEKEVAKAAKLYHRGIITEQERYNKVLDAWTHARERITKEMMEQLRNDVRDGQVYLNPIFLMAESGARGGVEQIRQLAGMRGLMAKPSGKIIETPIKANFREGLSACSSTSARPTAPARAWPTRRSKTADSGYLTRKLADVAQNVVITMEDCGTSQGITKGVIYKGEKVEVSLVQSIRGRVSRVNIVNPITDEVVVRENEMITVDAARKLEDMQIEKIQVRSPMTCEATAGHLPALLRHGPGHRPARRAGHGRRHHRRAVDRRAGHPAHDADLPHRRRRHPRRRGEGRQGEARRQGQVRRHQPRRQRRGQEDRPVAQRRDPDPRPQGPRAREVRRPRRRRDEGRRRPAWSPAARCSASGTRTTSRSSPRSAARSATRTSSRARRCGSRSTPRATPAGRSWSTRATCTRRSSSRTPRGTSSPTTTSPKGRASRSQEGAMITAGTLLAKTPREVGGTQDITGGLPRVTELFEARRPKEPAVIAEIDGRVELLDEKRRGKRTIIVKNESGIEREHLVPHGKYLRVHGGDRVRAGDAAGRRAARAARHPPDLGRGGRPARTCSARSRTSTARQRVEIDDKHLEIIVAQMLRKVRVEIGRRHRPAARLGHRQVRVPGQEPGADELREDQGPRRDRLPPGRHRPPRPLRRRRTSGSRRPAARRPSGSAPSRPRRAPSSWGSPRPPCSPTASSRPRASRRRPRCSPRPPWRARSTTWSASRRTSSSATSSPPAPASRSHQEAEVRIRPEALEALAEKGPGYARYRDEVAPARSE